MTKFRKLLLNGNELVKKVEELKRYEELVVSIKQLNEMMKDTVLEGLKMDASVKKSNRYSYLEKCKENLGAILKEYSLWNKNYSIHNLLL